MAQSVGSGLLGTSDPEPLAGAGSGLDPSDSTPGAAEAGSGPVEGKEDEEGGESTAGSGGASDPVPSRPLGGVGTGRTQVGYGKASYDRCTGLWTYSGVEGTRAADGGAGQGRVPAYKAATAVWDGKSKAMKYTGFVWLSQEYESGAWWRARDGRYRGPDLIEYDGLEGVTRDGRAYTAAGMARIGGEWCLVGVRYRASAPGAKS